MPVLVNRIGKERLYSEAIESHISGWYSNAVASSRIRPADQPQLDYELPDSEDEDWRFTATVPVLPKPEVADWKKLEVPYAEPEVPDDLVDHELNVLRSTVAELARSKTVPPSSGTDRPRPRRRRRGGQRELRRRARLRPAHLRARGAARRHERRRDEGDPARAGRRRGAGQGRRCCEGDQGEGAARADDELAALRLRVRHPRGATGGHRAAHP